MDFLIAEHIMDYIGNFELIDIDWKTPKVPAQVSKHSLSQT